MKGTTFHFGREAHLISSGSAGSLYVIPHSDMPLMEHPPIGDYVLYGDDPVRQSIAAVELRWASRHTFMVPLGDGMHSKLLHMLWLTRAGFSLAFPLNKNRRGLLLLARERRFFHADRRYLLDGYSDIDDGLRATLDGTWDLIVYPAQQEAYESTLRHVGGFLAREGRGKGGALAGAPAQNNRVVAFTRRDAGGDGDGAA